MLKEIPAASVDMVLCDPPYGTTSAEWDNVLPFDQIWEQYKRIVKPNGAIVLFAAQPFTTRLIHSNMKDFRYCWYWKKNNATGGIFSKVQPMRCIEDVCVFYRKMPTYNPQGIKKLEKLIVRQPCNQTVYRKKKNPSTQTHAGYPKHFLEFKNEALDPRRRYHPTQKPVALLEYLIRTYTNEDDTVLDNCMGSGSTGVACVNTGRKFVGIELNKDYFDIAVKRIAEAQEETTA